MLISPTIFRAGAAESSAIGAVRLPSEFVDHFAVPYSLQRGKYMVETLINGRPLMMRLDTGCRRCIVPVGYLEQLGLEKPRREPDAHYKRTGSAIWKIPLDVQVGPLVRKQMLVDVFDGELWPGSPVLGNNFFEGYKKLVRSSRDRVEFFHHNFAHPAEFEATAGCVLPFVADRQRGTPIVEAKVNGRVAPVLFDTGANDAMWLTEQQADTLNVTVKGRVVAVGKSRVRSVCTEIPLVQIGALPLRNVKAYVFDKSEATWATDYVCFGTALLGSHDYFIDDTTGHIHILSWCS